MERYIPIRDTIEKAVEQIICRQGCIEKIFFDEDCVVIYSESVPFFDKSDARKDFGREKTRISTKKTDYFQVFYDVIDIAELKYIPFVKTVFDKKDKKEIICLIKEMEIIGQFGMHLAFSKSKKSGKMTMCYSNPEFDYKNRYGELFGVIDTIFDRNNYFNTQSIY